MKGQTTLRKAELITTEARLKEVSDLILNTSAVAADTEFFWERTFYPILGMVQLAIDDGSCWLIDTVAIPDISALKPVLESESVTKVLHDAPQDLGILARAAGAKPRTIFDTRVAAGFAGFESTCSLQSLLRDTLNIEISKDETRSNWIRRPLSESQLRYAAGDVLYLLELRKHLINACANDTTRGWLEEESAQLNEPSIYQERDPKKMFLRVKGVSCLNSRQLAILREVAEWREMEARQRDWPRGHVLRDPVLIALAQLGSTDPEVVITISDFPQRMPNDIIADLLTAIQRGSELPDAECPQPTGNSFARRQHLKSRTKRLLDHIRSKCVSQGIDPALAASRAEAESFIQRADAESNSSHKLAKGWRKVIIEGFNPA
ncbi:MAG: HRDC domain-containing protein [Kiritimatiellae bacterium]|jgi:ribonuclease D|nr:HRDC domain-containing protein [Kiritimatiellia bacterium]